MRQWVEGLVGPDYAVPVMAGAAALLALILLFIVIRLIRHFTAGTYVAGGRNRKTRLAVMDATAIDNQRRLVLVRRDDVEHLILIGGAADIVVERDIRLAGQLRRPAGPNEPAVESVFTQEPAQVARPAPPRPAPVPPQQAPQAGSCCAQCYQPAADCAAPAAACHAPGAGPRARASGSASSGRHAGSQNAGGGFRRRVDARAGSRARCRKARASASQGAGCFARRRDDAVARRTLQPQALSVQATRNSVSI